MKIAVVGAGIAGLTAARRLGQNNEVHLFEASPEPGGHAHTVDVEEEGKIFPVDMGFIVYNEKNYPLFTKMLDELSVETTESSMGFSVSDQQSGMEYSGEGWSSLLAAPSNVLRPDFWRTMRDFLRFCEEGNQALGARFAGTIDDFCAEKGLSDAFQRLFLRPMAGAIWSTPCGEIGRFPAEALLRFFERHGLLSLNDRPQWRTVQGGSRQYVRALLEDFSGEIYLSHPVKQIRRSEDGVWLSHADGESRFDEVVLAVHSDRALALLADPTTRERSVLGAIRYQPNEAILHCDRSLLPRHRRAWASWNVRVGATEESSIAVTYWMNKLQPLPSANPWCVTLNQASSIAAETIREKRIFFHPIFDQAALDAQARWGEISGSRGTHYCGAYWRYGFHEDGAWSGDRAARALQFATHRAA